MQKLQQLMDKIDKFQLCFEILLTIRNDYCQFNTNSKYFSYIIILLMDKSSSNNFSSPLRFIGATYLYNMLQDFRHLLIFDFRQNYEQISIRDSFHVYPGMKREAIIDVIALAERKATEKQLKYTNIQRVRRYFFINNLKLDPNYDGVQFVLKCLNQFKSKDDKFYALNDSFQSFAAAYPFMLLDSIKLKEASENSRQEFDKIMLYPYTKFPSQIILGKLYISNVYSSNSQKQLNDLGIVSLVDFIDYSQQLKVAEFKKTLENYHNWPMNKQVPVVLDFDIINKKIDDLLEKGKVLLYCSDGQTICPAFAISYLMYKAKLDVTTATLKVCQAISRVQINKMIYTQLLVYKPKK